MVERCSVRFEQAISSFLLEYFQSLIDILFVSIEFFYPTFIHPDIFLFQYIKFIQMRCVLEYSWMEKKISLSDQNIDWELFYKNRKWWLYRLTCNWYIFTNLFSIISDRMIKRKLVSSFSSYHCTSEYSKSSVFHAKNK